ncbi:hypothetical protein LTR78_009699 [Recurvomyces mirabilis]|uniref:BTB domain-containing protein n=1 Tax=Recurvomyces mirabilis TaxID=574656 RepID=A0AAE0TS02_9PEZI|nr:hypothetical protein LTR78_009699 [Recurvomyces mirabilis]KAK5150259.1 hypothetical protein LTS14_010235 [Recurvomyces mirabilis]
MFTDLYDGIVTIAAADSDATINVHKGLLFSQSAKLIDRSTHSKSESVQCSRPIANPIISKGFSVRVNGDSQRILNIFRTWLYTGRLRHIETTVAESHPASLRVQKTESLVDWDDTDLANLYAFAGHLKIRHLQNDITTALIAQCERLNHFVTKEAVKIIFADSERSLLAAYAIEERVRGGITQESMPDDLEDWPAPFLAGVMRTTLRHQPRKDAGQMMSPYTTKDACPFHDHRPAPQERESCREKLRALPVYLH